MGELPKTEEELQALVNQKLEEQKNALEKDHNEKMYKARKEYDAKLENYKKEMSLSEEERAKKLAEERERELNDELTELRAYKKNSIIKDRLAKEGLPTYFANDSRLLSAEDGELDKVLKEVKKDYEANLPKGNTHSSVVQSGGATPTNDKDNGANAMADTLKALIG